MKGGLEMRYQIVYAKRGYPLTVLLNDEENAKKMAESLRKAGYDVTVWLHTEAGAKKTDI